MKHCKGCINPCPDCPDRVGKLEFSLADAKIPNAAPEVNAMLAFFDKCFIEPVTGLLVIDAGQNGEILLQSTEPIVIAQNGEIFMVEMPAHGVIKEQ